MSFGFGVGDVLAVSKIAWKVYKSCKDAPESFGDLSAEVLSLHTVLQELEENLDGHELPATQQTRLKTIINSCDAVLQDLQTLVAKYESLGTNQKRTFDRLRWGSEEIGELRARLSSNINLLTAFFKYVCDHCLSRELMISSQHLANPSRQEAYKPFFEKSRMETTKAQSSLQPIR